MEWMTWLAARSMTMPFWKLRPKNYCDKVIWPSFERAFGENHRNRGNHIRKASSKCEHREALGSGNQLDSAGGTRHVATRQPTFTKRKARIANDIAESNFHYGTSWGRCGINLSVQRHYQSNWPVRWNSFNHMTVTRCQPAMWLRRHAEIRNLTWPVWAHRPGALNEQPESAVAGTHLHTGSEVLTVPLK